MFVHIVLWFQDGSLCAETFEARSDAERLSRHLRSEGRDPWHMSKALRGEEWLNTRGIA